MKFDVGRVIITGFKSYRHSDIELGDEPGLKYLGGLNRVTPRLGANGAGKSAFWDAVFWCLYGESIRGKRTSDLINDETVDVQVLLHRTDDCTREPIWVRRTAPPNRIYIENTQCEQRALDELLGMSKTRFRHSVIFGQELSLFYDMSSADRGVLLDDVLDNQLWLDLATIAGKDTAKLEQEISKTKNSIAYTKGQRDGIESVDHYQQKSNEWEEQRQEQIKKLQNDVDSLAEQIVIAQRQETNIRTEAEVAQATFTFNVNNRHDDLGVMLNDARSDHVLVCKEIELSNLRYKSFSEHSICSLCNQPISVELKEQQLAALAEAKQQLYLRERHLFDEVKRLAEGIMQRERERSEQQQRYQAVIQKAEQFLIQLENLDKEIDRQHQNLQNLKNQKNPFAEAIADIQQRRQVVEAELVKWTDTLDLLEIDLYRAGYWREGFRKIRLQQLQNTLAALSLAAENTMSAFGLDWSIKLTTEAETKSGNVGRSGIYITIAEKGVKEAREFSPGEEQRVRLAISLGFADVIQAMSNSQWRLMVLDEPTNGMSAEGIEDLLLFLSYITTRDDKKVWIVDHHGLIHSGFTETWQAIKDEHGSRLSRI